MIQNLIYIFTLLWPIVGPAFGFQSTECISDMFFDGARKAENISTEMLCINFKLTFKF